VQGDAIRFVGLSVLGPNGAGELPIQAEFQIGPGDLFVALVLVYVLAYLYLLEPIEISAEHENQIRLLLFALAIPLSITFLAVVLFTIFERDVVLTIARGLV